MYSIQYTLSIHQYNVHIDPVETALICLATSDYDWHGYGGGFRPGSYNCLRP